MPKRTSRVAVRFTPEELASVRTRARTSHTPLASYVRQAALGHAPRAKQVSEYADLIHVLNRVGISLATLDGDEPAAILGELRTVLHAASGRMGYARPSRRTVAAAALE
jgi:hypothetical protein